MIHQISHTTQLIWCTIRGSIFNGFAHVRHGVGALDYLIFCFPLDLCLDSQYRRRWNLASHMKSAKDQHNAWEKKKKKRRTTTLDWRLNCWVGCCILQRVGSLSIDYQFPESQTQLFRRNFYKYMLLSNECLVLDGDFLESLTTKFQIQRE